MSAIPELLLEIEKHAVLAAHARLVFDAHKEYAELLERLRADREALKAARGALKAARGALRAIRSDRPSAHTDAVWTQMARALGVVDALLESNDDQS